MREHGADCGSPAVSTSSPRHQPRRSVLVHLTALLFVGLILVLAGGGVVLYRQVTHLDRQLAAATGELRALRGQQARTEHRVGDLADDVREVHTHGGSTAARELDTAKVVSEAQDSVFTIYTDQSQGTALPSSQPNDGGTWLASNSHVVEDAVRADRHVRLAQGDRAWRGEVATWQDRPDVALIRVT